MRLSIIVTITGGLLRGFGLMFVWPVVVAAYYREWSDLWGFVVAGAVAIALGQLQKAGQRGTAWGVTGILFGLTVTVGSIVLMASAVPQTSQSMVSIDDFQMDPAALDPG